MGTEEIIQTAITKFFILGLFFSATAWCTRVYKALKHQESINHHRATSIKTFEAFNEAASDNTTKDAVLLETTRAIFGITATDYLDKESTGSNEQFRIIEIARQSSKIHPAGTD